MVPFWIKVIEASPPEPTQDGVGSRLGFTSWMLAQLSSPVSPGLLIFRMETQSYCLSPGAAKRMKGDDCLEDGVHSRGAHYITV